MPSGRFAPSPTGPLHLGNLRTALVAWLFARSSHSAFVMRVEDLDRTASREELVTAQLDDLRAIGLDWDGEPLRQSTRFAAYDAAIDALSRAGFTYPCYCTRKEIAEAARAPHEPRSAYPGTCRNLTDAERRTRASTGRPAALRFRADGATASFVDAIAGPTSGPAEDVVLRRNDGAPAYNLAVVVDDARQAVEQVVRGDGQLANTPSPVVLAQRLALPVPSYAHVPLVLAPNGQRLAKRDGAVTLGDQAAAGRPATSVLSVLAASLGLAEPEERVSARDLVDRFDASHLPRSPWAVPKDLIG
jgi:glutamyl-tRNA synthetase